FFFGVFLFFPFFGGGFVIFNSFSFPPPSTAIFLHPGRAIRCNPRADSARGAALRLYARPRTRRGRAQLPTLWQGISPGSLERIVATARSIGRSTYVPHRNLGIGLHHIPGASGFPSRAPGAGG